MLRQLHAEHCQTSDCQVLCCPELGELCNRLMSHLEEQQWRAYQARLQCQHQDQADSPQTLSERRPVASELPAQVSEGGPASMALTSWLAYMALCWLCCHERCLSCCSLLYEAKAALAGGTFWAGSLPPSLDLTSW